MEREKRERELRELRERDLNDRLKEELMKNTPGVPRPSSHLDSHWLELHRRYFMFYHFLCFFFIWSRHSDYTLLSITSSI